MTKDLLQVFIYCPNCESKKLASYAPRTWREYRLGKFVPKCNHCKTPVKVRRKL